MVLRDMERAARRGKGVFRSGNDISHSVPQPVGRDARLAAAFWLKSLFS
ncbi:MAG TPA: hypothetical protein VFF84_10440 [Sphingobium sp.]|nr:hypothetical protein [Sphingobium sp.]